MEDTISYNAGINTKYNMEIPRCIVENVQKQGFPSRLDELEEVSRRAIDFYEREENHAKVSEIKNFRDYLVEMEEENF